MLANVSGLGSALIKKTIFSECIRLLYIISLKFSHHIFFQNLSDLDNFTTYKILKKHSHSLLPGSGINTSIFPINNQHLLLERNSFIFSFIGRILIDKGILDFIDAARNFENNSYLKFNVFGDLDIHNPSSLNQKQLEAISPKNIHYHGKVSNIKTALLNTDCVILPSYREGMSRSLLEAASIGLPIITTNVPGCREIVEHGRNGYLVNVQDSNSICNAIENFINLSKKEIYDMGCKGASKVRKEFDVLKVIEEYIIIINS